MSRVHQDHTRCGSDTWICVCGHTHNLFVYSKLRQYSLRRFEAPEGQICFFSLARSIDAIVKRHLLVQKHVM